MNSQFDYL